MDEHGLYDIYETWHVPFWQTRAFYGVMLFLAAGIAVLLGYILFKRYAARRKSPSAQEQAMKMLTVLQEQPVTTMQQAQEVYFALTRILKFSINTACGYDLKAFTDSEMLAFLEKQPFSPSALRHMQDITGRAVQVKFARTDVVREQLREDIRKSISIVDIIYTYKHGSTDSP